MDDTSHHLRPRPDIGRSDRSSTDVSGERVFLELAYLAAQVCGAPAALVTYVDANAAWRTASYGLPGPTVVPIVSFDGSAAPGDIVVLANLAPGAGPLATTVTGMMPDARFFAGIALMTSTGSPLGTLCLMDVASRELADSQRRALECVGQQVIAQLKLRRSITQMASVAAEHRHLTSELFFQSQHDPLTGLPNRALFEDRLRQAIAHAQRYRQRVALFFIDIDQFKVINDTLGHHQGDVLLQEVSRRLLAGVRQTDTLARMGGDEFTLILTELNDSADAVRVARKILDSFKVPLDIAGRELFMSASVGISVYPQDGEDIATLQRNADAAMYRAKTHGRNGFQCFAPEMNAAAMERLDLEGMLRHAIEHSELLLYYQPQVSLDGRIVGLESLIRWAHPQRGMLPPAKFIPVAEDSGLIVPIGGWVLREACRQVRAWQDAGLPPIRVAVNVSARQFAQPEFVGLVEEAIHDAGIRPASIELEITESLLMNNTEDAADKLTRLRSMGLSIAIDDFGTGYSSLAYLQQLPLTTLKIDRAFVKEIDATTATHPDRTVVIRAVISLAHSLDLNVVAEGVETPEQLEFLRRSGCLEIQGYLFSPPKPVNEITPLLRAGQIQPHVAPAVAISA